MRIVLLLVFFISSLFAQESEYTLGQGIKIPQTPLYLGGYISTDYAYFPEQKENRLRIDDIALLAYGRTGKLSYLAEFEYKEFYTKTWGDTKYHEDNTHLLTERVFASYLLDENYRLQVGKFNVPIGFWNLTPINVLRETSSSPLSNSILFPRFITGINLEYKHYSEYELKINILMQENKDLDRKYNNFEIDALYGLGVEYGTHDISLRLDGGYFHLREPLLDEREIYYGLASLKVQKERYEIMAELGTQFSKERTLVPYAGYLQGVYRLTEKHHLISRLESYKQYRSLNASATKDTIAILAYTYRPLYPIALKAEYQFHSLAEQDGVIFSFSVLF